jgi:transcription elongation factor SPT5
MAILQRCFDRELLGQPLQIKSAIASDNLVGYIHIEAKTQAHVRQVCSYQHWSLFL